MKGNYNQGKSNSFKREVSNISWRRDVGRLGEDYVANWLKTKGWLVIERNWRAGRYAELDIIAFDPEGHLVFIEVKTRIKASETPGFENAGFEKLDAKKRQKMYACARLYMTQCRLSTKNLSEGYRFDAFVLYYPPLQIKDLVDKDLNKIQPKVQHIENFIQ